MATHEIKRFFRGPRTTVRRLNEVVDGLNTVLKLDGDSFIRIDKTPSGFVIRLDIREVKKRLGPGKTVSEGGTGTSGAPSLYKVMSTDGTTLMYNCRRQQLDGSVWDDPNMPDKVVDYSEVEYSVYNLAENDLTTRELVAGDLMLVWSMTDDEGDSRLVGVPASYAWWHAAS